MKGRRSGAWTLRLPQVREWSGEKILQGQGKVRVFHFESGKIRTYDLLSAGWAPQFITTKRLVVGYSPVFLNGHLCKTDTSLNGHCRVSSCLSLLCLFRSL